MENMESIGTGEDVIPQQYLKDIYAQVPGISYIDISIYHTASAGEGKPSTYPREEPAHLSKRAGRSPALPGSRWR